MITEMLRTSRELELLLSVCKIFSVIMTVVTEHRFLQSLEYYVVIAHMGRALYFHRPAVGCV